MGKMSDFRQTMKTKQAVQAVAEERPAQTPAKVDRPAPAKPPLGALGSLVRYACGHEKPAKAFLSGNCAECVAKTRQARAEKRRAKRAAQADSPLDHEPEQCGRLPDGAKLDIEPYDAAERRWRGTLTIGEHVFADERSGVMRLRKELDGQYRRHLAFLEAAAK